VRVYFAEVFEKGGFGMRQSERAAFIVADESGGYQCVAWPFDNGFREQRFSGRIPKGTVAIVHTHPHQYPFPSDDDRETALRFSLPVIVLTPHKITLVTARGTRLLVVEDERWWQVSARASSQCKVPALHASQWATD
jgi:proteasome lid subunit RPN8/RPN11